MPTRRSFAGRKPKPKQASSSSSSHAAAAAAAAAAASKQGQRQQPDGSLPAAEQQQQPPKNKSLHSSTSPPEILAIGAVLDHLARGGRLKEATSVYKKEMRDKHDPFLKQAYMGQMAENRTSVAAKTAKKAAKAISKRALSRGLVKSSKHKQRNRHVDATSEAAGEQAGRPDRRCGEDGDVSSDDDDDDDEENESGWEDEDGNDDDDERDESAASSCSSASNASYLESQSASHNNALGQTNEDESTIMFEDGEDESTMASKATNDESTVMSYETMPTLQTKLTNQSDVLSERTEEEEDDDDEDDNETEVESKSAAAVDVGISSSESDYVHPFEHTTHRSYLLKNKNDLEALRSKLEDQISFTPKEQEIKIRDNDADPIIAEPAKLRSAPIKDVDSNQVNKTEVKTSLFDSDPDDDVSTVSASETMMLQQELAKDPNSLLCLFTQTPNVPKLVDSDANMAVDDNHISSESTTLVKKEKDGPLGISETVESINAVQNSGMPITGESQVLQHTLADDMKTVATSASMTDPSGLCAFIDAIEGKDVCDRLKSMPNYGIPVTGECHVFQHALADDMKTIATSATTMDPLGLCAFIDAIEGVRPVEASRPEVDETNEGDSSGGHSELSLSLNAAGNNGSPATLVSVAADDRKSPNKAGGLEKSRSNESRSSTFLSRAKRITRLPSLTKRRSEIDSLDKKEPPSATPTKIVVPAASFGDQSEKSQKEVPTTTPSFFAHLRRATTPGASLVLADDMKSEVGVVGVESDGKAEAEASAEPTSEKETKPNMNEGLPAEITDPPIVLPKRHLDQSVEDIEAGTEILCCGTGTFLVLAEPKHEVLEVQNESDEPNAASTNRDTEIVSSIIPEVAPYARSLFTNASTEEEDVDEMTSFGHETTLEEKSCVDAIESVELTKTGKIRSFKKTASLFQRKSKKMAAEGSVTVPVAVSSILVAKDPEPLKAIPSSGRPPIQRSTKPPIPATEPLQSNSAVGIYKKSQRVSDKEDALQPKVLEGGESKLERSVDVPTESTVHVRHEPASLTVVEPEYLVMKRENQDSDCPAEISSTIDVAEDVVEPEPEKKEPLDLKEVPAAGISEPESLLQVNRFIRRSRSRSYSIKQKNTSLKDEDDDADKAKGGGAAEPSAWEAFFGLEPSKSKTKESKPDGCDENREEKAQVGPLEVTASTTSDSHEATKIDSIRSVQYNQENQWVSFFGQALMSVRGLDLGVVKEEKDSSLQTVVSEDRSTAEMNSQSIAEGTNDDAELSVVGENPLPSIEHKSQLVDESVTSSLDRSAISKDETREQAYQAEEVEEEGMEWTVSQAEFQTEWSRAADQPMSTTRTVPLDTIETNRKAGSKNIRSIATTSTVAKAPRRKAASIPSKAGDVKILPDGPKKSAANVAAAAGATTRATTADKSKHESRASMRSTRTMNTKSKHQKPPPSPRKSFWGFGRNARAHVPKQEEEEEEPVSGISLLRDMNYVVEVGKDRDRDHCSETES